jgi:hypothetical protein
MGKKYENVLIEFGKMSMKKLHYYFCVNAHLRKWVNEYFILIQKVVG